MKELLLDTHVWIWVSIEATKDISKAGRNLIQRSRQLWISAISCWELAKLVEKKRLSFSIPTINWIRRSLNEKQIKIADLSPEIAVESTLLSDLHQDPADQIIVATSRILGIPLVTSDKKILNYERVETYW